MRGLIDSILVDFFNCLDVFFCFIALFYRFCPSIVCGIVCEESKKERAALFWEARMAWSKQQGLPRFLRQPRVPLQSSRLSEMCPR